MLKSKYLKNFLVNHAFLLFFQGFFVYPQNTNLTVLFFIAGKAGLFTSYRGFNSDYYIFTSRRTVSFFYRIIFIFHFLISPQYLILNVFIKVVCCKRFNISSHIRRTAYAVGVFYKILLLRYCKLSECFQSFCVLSQCHSQS